MGPGRNSIPGVGPRFNENGGTMSNKRFKSGKSESYDGGHTNGFSVGDNISVQVCQLLLLQYG